MMRKHINSQNFEVEGQLRFPYYSWQCITLKLKSRCVDLVIEDEDHMMMFIELLLFELDSQDGA